MLTIIIILHRHNQLFSQTTINKVGVAYYASNCAGIYLARQDTLKISDPKFFKLPTDTTRRSSAMSTRCYGSITERNPLLVIDGVVCEYNKLNDLNPNDILSVTVLKSDTYLSLCKPVDTNGVILITTKSSQNKTLTIKDLVTGQSIPNATILLTSKNSDRNQIFIANDSGIVKVERNNGSDNYNLSVSAIGYKSLVIDLRNALAQREILLQRDYKNCHEVIISSQIDRRTIHCGLRYRSLIINDDSINSKLVIGNFEIYPNPIQSNSTLNIKWKQQEFGDFMFQLFNQSGQLVFYKEINMSEGQKLFTIKMPSVIPGNYFLKLTNKTNSRSYTEKLIVN